MKGILGIITLCMTILLAGEAYADEPIKITELASPGKLQMRPSLTENGRFNQNGKEPQKRKCMMVMVV